MSSYAQRHAHRVNLLIHLVAVPIFILAHVGLVISIAQLQLWLALVCIGLVLLSLRLQRQGHAFEKKAPAPFANGWNFAARLYTEQFYTFPRFFLSGGFWKNWLATQSHQR